MVIKPTELKDAFQKENLDPFVSYFLANAKKNEEDGFSTISGVTEIEINGKWHKVTIKVELKEGESDEKAHKIAKNLIILAMYRKTSIQLSDQAYTYLKPDNTWSEARPITQAKIDKIVKKTIAGPAPVGGIIYGANSCFLATAMQTLNHVEVYRNLFDPQKKTLQKRDNESDESFEKRKEIQAKGFAIFEKIRQRNTVSSKEISDFRKACCEHTEEGKPVIEDQGGQIDSMETVDKILSVLDYKEVKFQIQYKDIPNGDGQAVNDGVDRKPEEYSTLADIKDYQHEANIELNGFNYKGKEVEMNELIKDFWLDEQNRDLIVKEVDANNSVTYKKYDTYNRSKEMVMNNNFPRVLRVTIQIPVAKIKDHTYIYPSGQDKVGPRYRLVSIIQHKGSANRGGHYVGYLKMGTGLVKVDGTRILNSIKTAVQGYGYFYIRDDEAQAS